MTVVVLKLKNKFFCHDRGVVDVVAINVFFMMKPNVNNFWHDHGVVNVLEKYKKIFF